ncbi:hypothetical protein [Butyrivibrio fibrisolvens]|uniref:hypothetical protein n=1 Tax=Butyrivibrio fibrisolvens TaxID=831 RepID=UPI0003B3759B|nr:hypothetical protein [Butyrivibrio fibrisolvens]
MEKSTIMSYVAVGVGIVALILSLSAGTVIKKQTAAITYNPKITVATASGEAASATTATSGDATTEGASTTATIDTSNQTSGAVNLVESNGLMAVSNSTLKVPKTEDYLTTGTEDLYVYLEGTHYIKYDSRTDYLVVDNSAIIRTITATDAIYEGICQYTGQNNETILIGERLVTTKTAIAVTYTIPTTADGTLVATVEDSALYVQSLLDNTQANVRINRASMFGYSINPDWVADLVVTTEGAQLIKGDASIYIAPYTGSFAAGTTNSLTAGGVSFTYSESIKDETTEYVPYIVKYPSAQDGTVPGKQDALQAKLLAKSNLTVQSLMGE